MQAPCHSPWRTIEVSDDACKILASKLTLNLNEPCALEDTSWIKPVKYIGIWWELMLGKSKWYYTDDFKGVKLGESDYTKVKPVPNHGANNENVRRYIDFAAAMGYRSLLIDALWDVQIGRERIAQLSQYARSKGVGLYLWYNSNGAWNDAPQSPRGIMNDPRKRREEMKWMQEIGVLGIKVDFFGGDKQPMMQYYEDILSDANEFGIMCIFHGCTLPRGWERMYPNYVSSEAVPASENLHFSQGFCNEEARDCGAMYPFTRNAVGAMDFGGSALNKFYNANNRQGSHRITSDIYALATAVLFQSPVQHFALAPNNLNDAPPYAIDFMKSVPTRWEEVRFIDGYPGKYIIMARRSGNKWYIAGVNAMEQPLQKTITLPMLPGKSFVSLYQNGEMKSVNLSRKQTIKVEIPTNGGFVIVG
jgi:hypothetical protein